MNLHRAFSQSFAVFALLLAAAWLALAPGARALAQTTTSGDVAGTITDPSGAAIPGAKVTLANAATGNAITTSTNASGDYRFSLLPPGRYTLTATATGFAPKKSALEVTVGQVRAANLELQVGTATQTVEVTAQAEPVQIHNGNISTGFTAQQVQLVPNGGGDLTATVQATPGAVMNTQSGYGNFETYGLPATSNLFTVNGQPDNDPFLNLNNSGPTNLMLGQNDVEQVTVTNNGYSGQYGQLGGANINYVTMSGGNAWHGNALWNWNGRVMNANNFFNNSSGTARPFDNANQWAARVGGPLVKNKTFVFFDTEGLDVVLPTNSLALIPSPGFQSATLANLAATGNSAQVPFYQSMFNLYNSAPGAANATPVPGGGCGTNFALPGGGTCALQFRANSPNHTHEWTLNGRVDEITGPNDHMYLQLSMDRGTQATFTDPISPTFNITSDQPAYRGQYNWTHSFTAGAVNQMILSASHYSAIFGDNAAARSAVFPYSLNFSGAEFTPLGGIDNLFPQGRKVTQYGITDDYSTTMGAHTLKAGINYNINYINDYDFGINTTPFITTSLSSFYNGTADVAVQAFPSALNQPVRMYTLGAYLEDDVQATRGLMLTFALRAEHDSNPVCVHNCISRLTSPFTALNHDPNVPYNQVIQTGLRTSYPGYQAVLWQPRFGFAWTPFASQRTVLRGGFGLFNDQLPGLLVDSFAGNSPVVNTFNVTGALAPAATTNVLSLGSADNASFLSAFASGGTLASISATNAGFAPPQYFTSDQKLKSPLYLEWNFEIQQQIGGVSALSINYVGNHGEHEPIQNDGFNAFFPGFAGLPATAPDARFGSVNQLVTGGNSNYNGLTVSFSRKLSHDFQFQANYTWSHALDTVSNGGFLPFALTATQTSFIGVQDPYNIFRYNYGNADYDVRHYFSLNYVWTLPFRSVVGWGPDELWRGWTLSGTLYARSGLPVTVLDGNATTALEANNYGVNGGIFGNVLGVAQSGTCTVDVQCISSSAFSPSTSTPTAFGNQIRNQYRGPRFFDTDLSVVKNTQIPGWEKGQLGIGLQFFNLFNHPNFDLPVPNLAASNFGTIINTATVPTSIFGAFLGGDASPRIIEFTTKLTF
jgi:hypothetical protein